MVQVILLGLQEPQCSGVPKTMDTETMLQVIEANLTSSTESIRRVQYLTVKCD